MALEFDSNIVVLYREDDDDSFEFAQYYIAARGLPDAQLIAVPCSDDEILPNYDVFYEQVEGPILDTLSEMSQDYTAIKYLIVGYNVPGGFYDGTDVIATTSRLSYISNRYQASRIKNPLYFRRNYVPYSEDDNAKVIICSRIDGPSLSAAKSIVDSATLLLKQKKINGKFYFDKIAVVSEYGEDSGYLDDLEDFEINTLPTLNMVSQKTVAWDSDTDVPFFRVEDDSFLWAWGSERTGHNVLSDKTSPRVFLYNADSEGAFSVRDSESLSWPSVALSRGYIACGGSLSDPTFDGHLRPRPFFEALLNGATIGEAFIFAMPYLNWSVGLFGDPLVMCKFPSNADPEIIPDPGNDYQTVHDFSASALSYYIGRSSSFDAIRATLDSSTDFEVKTQLWYASIKTSDNARNVSQVFAPVASSLLGLTTSEDIQTFLDNQGAFVSTLIAALARNSDENLVNKFQNGFWYVDHVLSHGFGVGLFYQFELDAAYDEDFYDVFLSSDSETDFSEWKCETDLNVFKDIPPEGVHSGFVDRRIRFTSPHLLPTNTVIYVRTRQRTLFTEFTSLTNDYTEWVVQRKVIFT